MVLLLLPVPNNMSSTGSMLNVRISIVRKCVYRPRENNIAQIIENPYEQHSTVRKNLVVCCVFGSFILL